MLKELLDSTCSEIEKSQTMPQMNRTFTVRAFKLFGELQNGHAADLSLFGTAIGALGVLCGGHIVNDEKRNAELMEMIRREGERGGKWYIRVAESIKWPACIVLSLAVVFIPTYLSVMALCGHGKEAAETANTVVEGVKTVLPAVLK